MKKKLFSKYVIFLWIKHEYIKEREVERENCFNDAMIHHRSNKLEGYRVYTNPIPIFESVLFQSRRVHEKLLNFFLLASKNYTTESGKVSCEQNRNIKKNLIIFGLFAKFVNNFQSLRLMSLSQKH